MENTKNSSQELGTQPATSSKMNDEIDLADVLGKFGAFAWRAAQQLGKAIRYLCKVVGVVLMFMLRNILWLGIAGVLGLVMSYMSYTSHKGGGGATYRSDMVARMNVETNDFAVKFINDFGRSASTPQRWKTLLNLPDTILARQVVSINAYWGVDYNGDKIMDVIDIKRQYNKAVWRDSGYVGEYTILSDRFYVVMVTKSAEVVPYIEKAIKDKINNNPALLRQKEVDKNAIKTQIADIDYQIKTLDSLQRYEYFSKSKEGKRNSTSLLLQTQGQIVEFTERDQRLLHKEVLELQKERLKWVTKLQSVEQEDIIEILQSPTDVLIQEISFSNFSVSILLSFLIGMTVILLVVRNRKWLFQLWFPKSKVE
ncbi:hypothetical protein FACS1894156_8470 [Bacteroidia bacterium]|nr:hypothetical protein FACS1894156_8470 [Bacteroidia bacterium]